MCKFIDALGKQIGQSSRRSLLEIGGLGALGLGWPGLLRAGATPAAGQPSNLFGQAKSCVVVFQFGGPGQQDLWDLKPDAPVEQRGEFRPIDTNVAGIQIGDRLPLLSRQAHTFTIARSVSHKDFEHGSASYTALTGQPHPMPGTNTPARPDDFPTYGATVAKMKPTGRPIPSAVVLGPVMHQGNRPPMAGQNAGFLGQGFEPFRIADDPSLPDFRVSGLVAPEDVTGARIEQRFRLLRTLEDCAAWDDRSRVVAGMDKLQQRAFGLLRSSLSKQAFDLAREKQSLRDRYGRHKFGQTMLLARRLVEAEVPLITVNWSKLNADQWDTHKRNYPRLRELLPPFDRGMAAFLADLTDRGLLDTTLVICLGEFGRTPKMNKDAGRDHWPDCYSVLLAGGGITRGAVYGASDKYAAYPVENDFAPWDLATTMFHLLGINPDTDLHDRLNRPFRIARGRVVNGLLGS